MWQVSLLLASADKLPASAGAALAQESKPGKDGANANPAR